jgi:hypothetical protein
VWVSRREVTAHPQAVGNGLATRGLDRAHRTGTGIEQMVRATRGGTARLRFRAVSRPFSDCSGPTQELELSARLAFLQSHREQVTVDNGIKKRSNVPGHARVTQAGDSRSVRRVKLPQEAARK